MQNNLTKDISIAYNAGVETGEETKYFWTVAPGVQLGKRWFAYVEAFGDFNHGESDNRADAGISTALTKNIRIDLSGGKGLGNSELKWYGSLGFSFRIKTK